MKKKVGIIIGLVSLCVAYWLISPLFIDKVVNEEFSIAVSNELPVNTEDTVDDTPIVMNLEDQLSSEIMKEFENEMNEIDQEVEMNEPANGTGYLVSKGTFEDVAHHGSGSVSLYGTEDDGPGTLRIEDLDVLNGPDLRVLLSKKTNVRSSDDLGEYIELGKLKGNKGNQNYEFSALEYGLDFKSVIIYCKPFGVVFNSANLN
jgi:hypothetical protein